MRFNMLHGFDGAHHARFREPHHARFRDPHHARLLKKNQSYLYATDYCVLCYITTYIRAW